MTISAKGLRIRFQNATPMWACILVCASIAAACVAGDQRDIARVSQGNEGALGRLSQLSFAATVEEHSSLKRETYTVWYWRSGDQWRMKLKAGNIAGNAPSRVDLDMCSSGSELRSVSTNNSKGMITGVMNAARAFPSVSYYDVWGGGLLSLHTRKGALTLSQFLAQGEVLKAEVSGRGESDADVLLRVKYAGETATLWVSQKHNYLVRKRSSDPDAEERTEVEIAGFHEPLPGVFFPAHVEAARITKGGRTPIRTINFRNVVVDKSHPAGIFALKYPRGTWLFNEPRKESYEADEDGKPIGKVTKVPESALMPYNPAVNQGPPLTETKEEPRSWTRHLLPVSAVVLIGALIWWAVRRRRAAAST